MEKAGIPSVFENVNISAQSGDAITLPKKDVDIILKGITVYRGETALFAQKQLLRACHNKR